jgi:hypothetical protein
MIVIQEDPHASPERALLSAVILAAVNDACKTPIKPGRDVKMLLTKEAFSALRFLFDDRVSGIKEYADWLELDHKKFQRNLLAFMRDDSNETINKFSPGRRRNFRINYRNWCAIPENNYETLTAWAEQFDDMDMEEFEDA